MGTKKRIVAIDENGKKQVFDSVPKCAFALNLNINCVYHRLRNGNQKPKINTWQTSSLEANKYRFFWEGDDEYMAAPKVTLEALDNHNGVSRYKLTKKRGKLTLDDVQNTLRERMGAGRHFVWQWRSRAEDGNGMWYDEENEGDCVIIETAEPSCNCPVCLREIDMNF